MEIKIYVMASGAFIGQSTGLDDLLIEPFQLGLTQDRKVALIPLAFAPKAEAIKLNQMQIIYEADPDEGMINAYEESLENLRVARSGLVVPKIDEKLIKITKN